MSAGLLSLNPVRVPTARQAVYPARGRSLTVRTVAANWGTVKGQGDTKKKDSAWLSTHADSTRNAFSQLESDVKVPQLPRFLAAIVAGGALLAILNASS